MQFPHKKRTRPTIHLTALIDIVFMLLIFFLLASSFVEQQGVAISMPEVNSEGSELLPDIILQIDHNGIYYFNQEAIPDGNLFYLFQNKLKLAPTNNVVIKADRRVLYDKVVYAIDAAKLAGAKNILLLTKKSRPVKAP